MQIKAFERKKYTAVPPGANGYYLKISDRIGHIKWICVILLVVTVAASVIFARDEMSLHNFTYLVKHFDVNSADNAENFSVLRYDSNGSYNFGFYKDDLVIVSSTSVEYYDMKGNPVLSKNHSISNPRLVSTDGYLYVYDQGGYSYSVYDSFFNLKNEVCDYPISKIAASDSGVFAVVTKDINYRSAVYIYDKSFKLLSSVLKDKIVIDVSLARDGSRVLILSCETDLKGNYYTELMSVRPGQSEPEFTVTLDDVSPLYCGFFSDGSAFAVLSDSIVSFDRDGEKKGTAAFPSQFVTAVDMYDNSAALSFNDSVIGSRTTVYTYSSDCTVTGSYPLDGAVRRMKCDGGYIFAMLNDSIARISMADGDTRTEQTDSNPLDFIIRSERALLVCYGNRTQAYDNIFPVKEEISDDN